MYSYYTKPYAACTTIIVLKVEQSVEYIVFVCVCVCVCVHAIILAACTIVPVLHFTILYISFKILTSINIEKSGGWSLYCNIHGGSSISLWDFNELFVSNFVHYMIIVLNSNIIIVKDRTVHETKVSALIIGCLMSTFRLRASWHICTYQWPV